MKNNDFNSYGDEEEFDDLYPAFPKGYKLGVSAVLITFALWAYLAW